jgi:hypothetical protein
MEALTLLWQVRNGTAFVDTVLSYLLPLLLYCAWSSLVFLELAWSGSSSRRVWSWSVATLCLPFLGPALFLLAGPATLTRATRLTVVAGGAALVVLGYLLTFLIR